MADTTVAELPAEAAVAESKAAVDTATEAANPDKAPEAPAPAADTAPAAATEAPAAAANGAPAAESNVPVAATPVNAVPAPKTKDADSVKLFIGQIPRHYTAELMLPFFEPFGEVFEWSLLVDRMTGLHKGCGFLTYKSRASAMAAMEQLHDKQRIEGANRPIQVKPADSEQGKVAAPAEEDNSKLFIGMLARTMDEAGLKQMFGVYGAIEDAMILKNLDDGSSKGCGFVKFATRDMAQAAVTALHGQHTTEGNVQPLVVKFADTPREKAQRRQQKMVQQQGVYGQQQYGQQQWGQPQWGQQQQQWGQQQQQQQWGQQQQQWGQQQQQQWGQQQQAYGQQQAAVYGQQPAYGQQAAAPVAGGDASQSYGPEGGNLFLYHLPNEWTDTDVQSAFAPFGRVVSAKVFIDKTTGLSKCFGFVSYDNNQSAANAIQTMNGYQVAPGKRLRVQLKRPREQGNQMGMAAVQQQQFPQKPY